MKKNVNSRTHLRASGGRRVAGGGTQGDLRKALALLATLDSVAVARCPLPACALCRSAAAA